MPNEVRVFYSPASRVCIDIVTDSGTSKISGETIEQLAMRYPDVVIMDIDDAISAQEQSCLSVVPTQITRTDYVTALESLPPADWVSKHDTESFKMSECLSGRVTAIYARLGTHYYQFYGLTSMKHEAIIAFCGAGTLYRKC